MRTRGERARSDATIRGIRWASRGNDAYAALSRGKEQWTVRASRSWAPKPTRTAIGPIEYEVLEPMRRVRFRLESNEVQPIAFDGIFESVLPPLPEDRTHLRAGYRVSSDLVRHHQTGVVDPTVGGEGVGNGQPIASGPWPEIGLDDEDWMVRPNLLPPSVEPCRPGRRP